eukprot:CAMPEP_0194345732 /NCGR_PEP_ID=MMETSP0171-20130528/105023_1 /TAXON_ID=218684 /ORGANISM="Corethron pennatum, Strain L29A3" /LENGTH=177 /DNA_ID=CAMNT_0039112755 /DNA_START=466 /DNA_END=999 /DNA_ORIENTATION=+
MYALTSSIPASFWWNVPAASAVCTGVFLKTSVKCSDFPAPLLMITAMPTADATATMSRWSYPLHCPSMSIKLSTTSPAPSFSQAVATVTTHMFRVSRLPLKVACHHQKALPSGSCCPLGRGANVCARSAASTESTYIVRGVDRIDIYSFWVNGYDNGLGSIDARDRFDEAYSISRSA